MRASFAVAQLLTGEAPRDVQRRLEVLRDASTRLPCTQYWLHLGPGPALPGAALRVHAPAAQLRALALRRALQRVIRDGSRSVILHAWSRTAAEWALPLRAGNRPLLVEYDGTTRAEALEQWSCSGALACVCDSVAAAEKLHRAGVARSRYVVVRPPVAAAMDKAVGDRSETVRALRAAVRARLRVREADKLIALVPPLTRGGGGFITAWATLLLEKVEPGVRLVLMPEGAGAERVRYMIGACRHEHMFRVAPPEFSWKQLAVAADMAAWSAAEASATVFAAEAVHAGCRVVATRTRVACELLGEGYPWLCRPNDPQGAAATMLRALGNPPPTPCPAPGWCTECAPEHAAARYVEVYTRLAARRPVV